jgi:hypothetical protein
VPTISRSARKEQLILPDLFISEARRLEDGKHWHGPARTLRQRCRSGQTFRDKKDGCFKVVLKP